MDGHTTDPVLGGFLRAVDRATNPVGEHTSIAIGADGLPIISHHENGAEALRVTKCSTAACQ